MLSKIVFVLGMSIIGSAIACNLSGNWGSACRSPDMLKMSAAMKKALVDIHNKHRNEIALGKVAHYSPAANMATMQWDDGLASGAALNVHQCEMKHDNCNSGQNLAMSWTTGKAMTGPQDIANLAGSQWFDGEQINGGYYGWMNLINHFNPGDTSQHEVLHFTQFIWAKANKVGCAVSTSITTQSGRNANTIWLACNYPNGNLLTTPVYIAGASASQCKTGKNNNYPGLCSKNEKY